MYETTYKTISDVYGRITEKGYKAYLIGGISAAIQTNRDLYRQNDDLDIMINVEDLPNVIEILKDNGYDVQDKRGVNTRNLVDKDGVFHPADHEFNANSRNPEMLGIGIFLYKIEGDRVIVNSYAYDERVGKTVGNRLVLPKELFELMYSNNPIGYHGTKVMSSSKEYTYMTKSNGTRDKDKIDTSILESVIGEKEQEKIKRIKVLQKRVKRYADIYSEKGEIESIRKEPELEDTVHTFISKYSSNFTGLTQQQILDKLLAETSMQEIMSKRDDVKFILDKLAELEDIDDLADSAKKVAHIYCYSDDIETDMKQLKKDDFREQLVGNIYSESEATINVANIKNNLKNKDENNIINKE